MRKITSNQANLIKFIHEYRVANSMAPTLQEMVDGISVSDNKSILGVLEALEKHGYIKREKKKSRSITLTDKGQYFLRGYLLPWEYKLGNNPTPADQLRQSAEMMQTSVTVSSPTSDPLTYQHNSIPSDGTTIGNDLKTVVETAVSLAINRHFSGINTINANVEQKLSGNISGALGRLLVHPVIGGCLGWAALLSGFVWVDIHILGSGITPLTYSVIQVFIIKNFLIK
jgi:hypothetical protein